MKIPIVRGAPSQKNKILVLLLLFFISSCAHQTNTWPAKITGFKNFTFEEINQINNHINDLNLLFNLKHKKTLIKYRVSDENYKILIKFENEIKDRVAGTAMRLGNECIITIYPVCFEKQILKTVIWHELGHCAKLNHSELKDDIMYKSARPFSSYKEEDVIRFIEQLKEKTWK